MKPGKKIYILIGPKGSGKTYIGTLLERQLQVPFLRVEDIALQVKKERHYQDADYIQEVFQSIERAIRRKLQTEDEVLFESTGLTEAFDQMLERLKSDFSVMLINIKTEMKECLRRVKARDQSIHINVSDEHVMAINIQTIRKAFAYDGVIDNNNAGEEKIIETFLAVRERAVKGKASTDKDAFLKH